MRQLLLSAALAAALSGTVGAPLQAQDFSPVVYVNNSVVTRYEIQQRARFMSVLNAPEQGEAMAEKLLIDDRLRLEAARQIGVEVSDEGLEQGLSEFAGRAGMSTGQFIQALERSGVERQAYRDFVKAGVAWREVVRQRIAPAVSISDAEVDQAMKRIIETPVIKQVLLSELIIPAPPGQERAAMERAENIAATARSEGAFAEAARRYSATPTAPRGGRLDWMQVDNMPPSLRGIVLGLKPGQMTPPLTVPGAVVLFFLRDTRGTLRPGAEEQVLDYVRFTLASTAEAARIAAASDTCSDLFIHARGLPPEQIEHLNLPQGQVPTGEAVRLAVLDDNESTIVSYGGAVQLLMLCKRSPALLANPPEAPVATAPGEEPPAPDPNALPERDEVRNMIFNRKVGQAADAYMAELRANAVIRRP